MQPYAIGIDLGGTNLKGIVMDETGVFRHLTRVPTEARKGGVRVLDNILKLIKLLVDKEGGAAGIRGVGIGTPGFVDHDGTVLGGAENLPGWRGTQVFVPIRERFGLAATAGNDVTVMALAEQRFGAGKGIPNMVCLALGTGVGGGIVVNNQLYKGTHGMAGELGHLIVETNGIQCPCGLKGCVEQYASATAIVNLTKAFSTTGIEAQSELAKIAREKPDTLSAKLVYDYVKKNDLLGIKVNETVGEKLGIAIGMILNALAPDRVILGGGVMMAGQVIIDSVSRYAPRYCWPQIWERCSIMAAQLGEDAGVLGAAAMVFDEMK